MEKSNEKRQSPDPFAFARITSSQEELLNNSTFVADTLTSPCNCNNHYDIPSSTTTTTAAAEFVSQPSSVPQLFMCSAPDTQHFPQLVIDVPFCAFNQAFIDVHHHSQLFFDSSELGFQENLVDEFSDFDREISVFHDPPANLGFDSVNNVLGGEQVNVPNQNVEEEVVTESSRMCDDPVMTFMPDSIRCVFEKGAVNGRETRKDKGKNKFSVFAILKVLAQTEKEEDDGLTVLETAKLSGMKFPRPCWWPENMKSELFNFDDPVKM